MVISVFMFYRVLLCNNAQLIWWLNNIRWSIILDVNKTYFSFCVASTLRQIWITLVVDGDKIPTFESKLNLYAGVSLGLLQSLTPYRGNSNPLGFWPWKQSPLFTPILPIPGLAEGLLTNQSSNAHHYLK